MLTAHSSGGLGPKGLQLDSSGKNTAARGPTMAENENPQTISGTYLFNMFLRAVNSLHSVSC